MTNMQIAYWNLQELKRSNQAKEKETNRSNLVNEGENRRHNMQSEGIGWAQVGETTRHNTVMEAQGADQLMINASKVGYDYEVASRNAATKEGELAVKQQEADTHARALDETIRHNQKTEKLETWDTVFKGANTLINVGNSISTNYANYSKALESQSGAAKNVFGIISKK